jgi:hypothetical protein
LVARRKKLATVKTTASAAMTANATKRKQPKLLKLQRKPLKAQSSL